MRQDILFEVLTRDGKEIRLTQKQWSHISQRHPEMQGLIEEMRQALMYPTHMLNFSNETIKYYLFLKNKRAYIMVAVKVLSDNQGFIMTSYLTSKIQ
ncbi:MAG TPA: hypothetical protein VJI32_07770 [Candidatus Nanoarchaeia archaeon]|nr:hypothetical protein [Candidatus Nanoarchaeia archaeon]